MSDTDDTLFHRDFEGKEGRQLDAIEEARAVLPFNRNDELDKYFAAFKRYPKFPNREAFLEAHTRFRAGATEEERLAARDEIVYRNARLVFSVAYPMSGRGLGLLDMLQEGAIGLMTALEKYQVELGYAFSTYATHWIRQAISRAITELNERRPYRIPVHVADKMWPVQQIIEKHVLEQGQWPKPKEVLEELQRSDSITDRQTTLGQVVACMRILLEGYVSLDQSVGEYQDDGDLPTLGTIVEDERVDTESVVEARRMLHEYEQALARIEAEVDKLDPRSAMVIRLRFGFGEFDSMTLQEVSERYEITRERIRQIEVKALGQLGEILSVTGEEISQIIAAVTELRNITGAEPAERAAETAPEKNASVVASLDHLFGLLCEHVMLTPAGLRIVKAPLATLQVRGRLIYGEACAALGELQTRGLIEGVAPWVMIKIIPEVAIPEYRHGAGQMGKRDVEEDDEEVEDAADEGADGIVPSPQPPPTGLAERSKGEGVCVPVVVAPRVAGSPEAKPRGRPPASQSGIQHFPAHKGPQKRRAGVILDRLTYAEVYEVLTSRASAVSGERVVRGAAPILETWFKIWTQDATRVLEKLAEQGYITARDGFRVIVLHYDRLDRQELMFGVGVVSAPAPTAVGAPSPVGRGERRAVFYVPPSGAQDPVLRVIPGGEASPRKEAAVRAPAPLATQQARGPRHDVLDTAVRWIEQQLPHLRASLGEAHERLVKLEVACITLRKARDGHQQTASAVEGAIAEMESAMQEFFTLLRQG
ncbi:sigma-70 family RNA polymerase sigma factor [Candidatus Uhrbacteria bacterium]|nr:sigma-70 family RNA polymerase sigma factor [Candidatus Uhrbacteria bacterium]